MLKTAVVALAITLTLMAGCLQASDRDKPAVAPMSAEDKALRHKFRGLEGGQLFVDAFGKVEGVSIYNEHGDVFYASATVSAFNNSKHAYGADFGVPKTLRVVLRRGPGVVALEGQKYGGGTVILDETILVASRIPDSVLNAVRAGEGGFRLKIRLSEQGTYIGWDVSRGFNLQYHAGGDFREAERFNGEVVRKGWYIDKKTGQKIETDF
jgi:hypothetical protein